jgi:two-component system cell cycle sensor histidine kinase PleC
MMSIGLGAREEWGPAHGPAGRRAASGLVALLREHGAAAAKTLGALTPAERARRRERAGKSGGTRRKSKIFLIITALIACSDGLFVYVNYRADAETLSETIAEEGRTLANAFRVIVSNMEDNLERVASEIAKDEEVQRHMLAAYEAGPEAAGALAEIRDRLFILSARFSHEAIHFHLGPDLVSLLRFHRQGLYGDRVAPSRPMVEESYRSNMSQLGFEVGGTLSGLRAVTPIRVFDAARGEFVRVGTVETISEIYPIIARFSEQIGGSAVVFLDAEHVEAQLMPRAVNMRYMQTEFLGDWVFEAGSDFSLLQQFQDREFRDAMLAAGTQLVEHDGRTLAVTNLPLRDYSGSGEAAAAPVGTIVLWRDASHLIAGFNDDQATNVMLAIGAFLLIEFLLFVGMRVATCQLTQIVQKQTEDLLQANRQLQEQSESLSEFAREVELARYEAEGARQAAEEASRAKSKFLASMSHELRTPLNAIIGFSSIIRDRILGDRQMDKYSEYAGDIFRSGAHLLEIIDDILDIAKIEAGHFQLNVEPMSLSKLVQDCLRLVRIRAQENKVAVVFAPPDADLELHADLKGLKRILLNLLSNAIKFTPAGGTVTVRVWAEPGDRAALAVADTGIGIPPDKLGKVLEPFEQVDNEYTRTESGTGLGLSLVRSIVELHGGELSVDSEPGRGTTVTVLMPRDPRGVPAATARPAPATLPA